MLPARIKKRPIRFSLWLLTLLSFVIAIKSFGTWFEFAQGRYRVVLVEGRLIAQRSIFSHRQGLNIRDGWETSGPRYSPLRSYFGLPRLSSNEFILPLGWPLVILTTFTTFAFWRPLKKPAPGLCPQCNYNLTANTTGKCPECGLPMFGLESFNLHDQHDKIRKLC